MSTQVYTNVEIYVDGAKSLEAQTVKITRDSKAQDIETLSRGWAGMSPGAKMLTIAVENAVPSASIEVDSGPFLSTLKVVELTIFAAGKTLTTKGFIHSDSFSGAVNAPSGLSFEFKGEYADWT